MRRMAWCLGLGALYAYGWHLRPRDRQPSVGAIAPPELVDMYARLSAWPPFRLLRWWIARQVTCGRRDLRVLDVGSGAGHLAILLAQQPQVREVIGVDLSIEMVLAARAAAELAGVNANFVELDAAELPFPDDAFDVVVSTLSMHHWEQPAAVLRQIARVLKPGGTAYLLDLRRDATPFALGAAGLFAQCLAPDWLKPLREPLASFQAAYTPCEAVLLAAEAGWAAPRCATGPAWLLLQSDKPAA